MLWTWSQTLHFPNHYLRFVQDQGAAGLARYSRHPSIFSTALLDISEASSGQMGYWSSYKFWVHQKMSEHDSNSESTFPAIPVTGDGVSCRSIIYYSKYVHWQLRNISLINPMQPQEEELFQNHSECAGRRPPTYIKPLTGAVLFLSGRYSVFRAQRDSDGGRAELSCTIYKRLQMCFLVLDIKKAVVVAANLLTQRLSRTTRNHLCQILTLFVWLYSLKKSVQCCHFQYCVKWLPELYKV